MRTRLDWLVVLGSAACHTPTNAGVSAVATTQPSSQPSPKVAPPTQEYGSQAYQQRLFEGFRECGNHDLGRFDGRWFTVDSPIREVWICDGHIRWMERGQVSDICMSSVRTVAGGMDARRGRDRLPAEATWHEDWHDQGDASGLSVYLREREQGLSVDAADWEEPGTTFQFFVLKRSHDPAERRNMPCPFE
jgi:hypothetical protein